MFNIVPLLVFGGLFGIWVNTSQNKLLANEQFYLRYLLWNLFFIYSYYSICVFSLPAWVYNKNWQVAAFVMVTLLFYRFNYRERK